MCYFLYFVKCLMRCSISPTAKETICISFLIFALALFLEGNLSENKKKNGKN